MSAAKQSGGEDCLARLAAAFVKLDPFGRISVSVLVTKVGNLRVTLPFKGMSILLPDGSPSQTAAACL